MSPLLGCIGGSLHTLLPSHTWLRTCRTPLVARRSATSTLAFCTQTLWKTTGRAQLQVGTGRHLRVGATATERLLGTQDPQVTPSLAQTSSDSGPIRWVCIPPAGPMHERDSIHMQMEMGRQPLVGQSLLAQRHSTAAKVPGTPSEQGEGIPISILGGASVQEAYSHSSFLPFPAQFLLPRVHHIPH